MSPSAGHAPPLALGVVVVHWGDDGPLRRLLAAWPRGDGGRSERVGLVVVDNGPERLRLPSWVVHVVAESNLGFGGGSNRGVAATTAPWILLLNPDARPRHGALDTLLRAIEELDRSAHDEHDAGCRTVGLVPALESPDGSSQHRWQLQPLPSAWTLFGQVFFLGGRRGPVHPPPSDAVIGQPAAAALALRRSAFDDLGGFDPRFHPAWFDDVDLARRLADRGWCCRYVPAARFVHDMGSSVSSLGYGRFLWTYLRNLERYLAKHHGPAWAMAARIAVPVAMALRLLALPLRRPRRARSRRDAARGLLAVAVGAVSGWRHPEAWA